MIGGGISLRGSVPTPLPLLPCVVLQAAIRFINLTVPSSAGRIAMNVRFLQRMGASTPAAIAAGAVDDVSEKVVKALLVAATLPFVRVDVDTSQFARGGPDTRLIVAIGIALVAGVAVVLAVPSLRAKVLPRIRVALATLASVARTRRKRLELFGGNLLAELLFALVLGAACRAYGADLSLAELVFVNTAAGVSVGPDSRPRRHRRRRGDDRGGPDRGRCGRVHRVRHRGSRSACAPSTCRRSGAIRPCSGFAETGTCSAQRRLAGKRLRRGDGPNVTRRRRTSASSAAGGAPRCAVPVQATRAVARRAEGTT